MSADKDGFIILDFAPLPASYQSTHFQGTKLVISLRSESSKYKLGHYRPSLYLKMIQFMKEVMTNRREQEIKKIQKIQNYKKIRKINNLKKIKKLQKLP